MNDAAAILDALPVALYHTDPEGRLTWYNDAAAKLWGWRPPLGQLWCGSFRILNLDGSPLPHEECPMAVTLKQGVPVLGAQAIAERPDGSRLAFMPHPALLRDENGKVTGAINVLVDVTDRITAETRLAAIVASSDDAIVGKTLDGIVRSWNAGAQRIFGYTAEEMIGQSIRRIIPPELQHQEDDIIARISRGERIEHFDTVRLAQDGKRVDVSLTISPIHGPTGRIIGASKIARDISERKQAETIHRLLIDELNHRVKNTLATVQAIGRQSLAHARSEREFVDSFTNRIQSLAKAHALLTESRMQGASLTELIEEQVLIGAKSDRRMAWSGPSLILDTQRTIHLGMILHELASNARRHGALSAVTGRVAIQWVLKTGAGRTLVLDWNETGGPPVRAQDETGFGTKLIQQTLRSYGGKAEFDFRAEGVHCRIELPLANTERLAAGSGRPMETDTSLLPTDREDSKVLKGKRVLVIEDEPFVALDICACLTSAGCEIIGPTGTLPEAKALIEQGGFDAAMLDLNLEGNTSDELAQALTRKNIPFAFLTGYRRSALPPAFRDSILLSKPFGREQLVAVAEALVYLSNPVRGVVQLRPAKPPANAA